MHIGTVSGKLIYFDDIKKSDIDIYDIATALSNICRFVGQLDQRYTVAQHSIRAWAMAPDALKLDALMHDAAEAYIGDLAGPIKHKMPAFMALEKKVFSAIADKYGLSQKKPTVVDYIDKVLVYYEEKEVRGTKAHYIEKPLKTMPPRDKLPPIPSISAAKDIFLSIFHRETTKRFNCEYSF